MLPDQAKRMALFGQVVEPFAEHHISGPAFIEFACEFPVKTAKHFMLMMLGPTRNLCHARIMVNPNPQIRVGNNSFRFGELICHSQILRIPGARLDGQI